MKYFLILFLLPLSLLGQSPDYGQFEGRQTHPVRLSYDGKRLFALNTPAGRLSVFDVSNTQAAPLLIAEIPVGMEPVSLAERTSDEVWVVNEVSDSVSVVSISRRVSIAHLKTGDEPADIVFAGDSAGGGLSLATLLALREKGLSMPAAAGPTPPP